MGVCGGSGRGGKGAHQIFDKLKPQLVTIRVRDGGSGAYVHESQLWGLRISHMEAALPTHLTAAPLSSPIAKSPIIPTKIDHSLFP